ncbi:LysR family transcriptional regulator [Paenibacillus wulumuqiensis]|uniref:LysR family transcriptional regulator n=1 Tax=Paenibacillus wulumuqiensis TaxID=1567107 RepID=UPI000697DC26|nr:LysR family transcriptional regulator [Paenibacillus wulumuqiensis]
MELLYLRTFCELVKWGNYTRTALELDYAQSSITNHIQRLEQLYGGQRLLQRSGNQVVPTPAGERLLPYARQLLELQQQAKEAVIHQQPEAPVLTIGTIESLSLYYLPERLEIFRNQYPGYKIKIVLGQESELIRQVREGKLDLALILDQPYQSTGIECRILFEAQMMIILHQQHPLADAISLSAAALADQPLILTEEGCTYRAGLLETMSQASLDADVRWELGSIEAIKQAVQKQWGIGFLPSFTILEEDRNRGICAVPWAEQTRHLYGQIIHPAQLSAGAQSFLQLNQMDLMNSAMGADRSILNEYSN